MNHRIINTLAAVGLTALSCLIANPTTASAAFKVRVDNLSNPAGYTNWGSPANTVFVTVHWKQTVPGTFFVPFVDAVPAANLLVENHDVSYTGSKTWADVLRIEIENDTDNMFGLDQVEILNSSGTIVRTYGVDNSNAWCLSTDPADAYTPDCGNTAANAIVTFYP